MKWKTVKKDSEIVLEGIKIELDFKDKGLVGANLTDSQGNKARFYRDGYGSLEASVPAPPELVTRYRVFGSFLGVASISDFFENEYEANERVNELKSKAGYPDDFAIKVEKVEVPEL